MRRGKKWFTALLTAVIGLALLPVMSLAASPADIDDNVKITTLYEMEFTGSGTQEDPYYAEMLRMSSERERINIRTVNPQAKINSTLSVLTVPLDYGRNDIRFSVTSADGSRTVWYRIVWERAKLYRDEGLKNGDLWSSPASDADGRILGLNPAEHYDYRASGSQEWIHVSGVSEITGLAAGTYEVRYGESETYKVSGHPPCKVAVGNASETMEIRNQIPDTVSISKARAASGERVDFKIRLDADEWVQGITVKNIFAPPEGWGNETTFTIYSDGYSEENGVRYYNAYIVVSASYSENRYIELKEVETAVIPSGGYHTISVQAPDGAAVKIEPTQADAVLDRDGTTVYRSGSSVTISVTYDQSWGTGVFQGFKVYDASGNVAAESVDGAPVTVTVTDDLTVRDIVIEKVFADFTAMEAQFARLDGLDLTRYTDDSRVAVEDRLRTYPAMYNCTLKDQAMVDAYTAELKAAIDGLVPKAGDFTQINDLLAQIPEDLTPYTDASVAALREAEAAARQAVEENWNRLRQEEIDARAQSLKDAIDGLKEKDTSPAGTPDVPDTGDSALPAALALMAAAAGCAAFCAHRRRRAR